MFSINLEHAWDHIYTALAGQGLIRGRLWIPPRPIYCTVDLNIAPLISAENVARALFH